MSMVYGMADAYVVFSGTQEIKAPLPPGCRFWLLTKGAMPHAIERLEPGVYEFSAQALTLVPEGSVFPMVLMVIADEHGETFAKLPSQVVDKMIADFSGMVLDGMDGVVGHA